MEKLYGRLQQSELTRLQPNARKNRASDHRQCEREPSIWSVDGWEGWDEGDGWEGDARESWSL